ncbi:MULTISPECIES: hypothetical protein [Bacillus]|uniref:Uncharacterized protein n=1 Tax=Bacillus thuringiensis serovar toumanoffi TaxID=180862 RepID=A0ABD5HQW0_BACTU|nr:MULTISPECIES: hypothetical protein [Bacillus]EEM92796.1 hypothetical protein bthur0013_58080 [Bacillus thuringiensis IBL 200]MBK5491352.1 hypothetical protein [Bacillus sp. TH17]MCR6783953.1 hypothetical protein [Bacillus thuringiensis]MCR6861773.1 hypothetical protein [Bacillus thuringiensis]MCR6868635.1 hypothetical protein [Bacillus thuringiensis]
MIEVIASLFLVVVYFISYLFSTGEDKKKAKAELKEIVNGTHGKILVGFFGGAAVTGIFVVIWILSE